MDGLLLSRKFKFYIYIKWKYSLHYKLPNNLFNYILKPKMFNKLFTYKLLKLLWFTIIIYTKFMNKTHQYFVCEINFFYKFYSYRVT